MDNLQIFLVTMTGLLTYPQVTIKNVLVLSQMFLNDEQWCASLTGDEFDKFIAIIESIYDTIQHSISEVEAVR